MTRQERIIGLLLAEPDDAVVIVSSLRIARPWEKRQDHRRAGVREEFETRDLASGKVLAEVYEFMGHYSWMLGDAYADLVEARRVTRHSQKPFPKAQDAMDDVDQVIRACGHRLARRLNP